MEVLRAHTVAVCEPFDSLYGTAYRIDMVMVCQGYKPVKLNIELYPEEAANDDVDEEDVIDDEDDGDLFELLLHMQWEATAEMFNTGEERH